MKVILAGYILGQGGIQSHLKWLSMALTEANVEVLIVSSVRIDKGISSADKVKLKELQEKGIKTFLPDNLSRQSNSLNTVLDLKRKLDEFCPDIYLAVGTSWNLFIPPLIAQSKPKCIFHEVMSGKGGRWKDSRWGVRWWFDEVVAQAPSVSYNFAESFGWKKPIPAIPALPEPLEITASLPQPKPKLVEMGQAKAAMFSRLVPWKRGLWLVQQWDLLKDILGELHIHGTGPEEELIREYISEKGIDDRVKCFGRYPEGQEYLNLLSSYDLTLLPTVGPEGAPLVLLESMACGVPFVTYGVGGLPDYGTNNPDAIIVSPEPWITDQAREYAEVETSPNQPNPRPIAFIEGVKQMAQKLAAGEIDPVRLQQYYLEKYSYQVLKEKWYSYLTQDIYKNESRK